MKAWQWAVLAGFAIIVIIVIAKESTPAPNPYANTNAAASGLGSFLSGLFKGSATKVFAPSGNPNFTSPGSSGVDTLGQDYTGGGAGSTTLNATDYGKQYSAEMAATAEAASASAGGAGATIGGGLSSVNPPSLGNFQLTPPDTSGIAFDTGTTGADFTV